VGYGLGGRKSVVRSGDVDVGFGHCWLRVRVPRMLL